MSGTGKKRKNSSILSFFNKQPKKDNVCEVKFSETEFGANTSTASSEHAADNNIACDPNDIGHFIQKQMNADVRRKLLHEGWNPDFSFKFPASGKRNLKFQLNWLQRWKWLSYSKREDGAFCKYCVLFSSEGAGKGHQPLGKLVKTKFSKWKDAVEEFNSHEKADYHKTCVLRAAEFVKVLERVNDPIDVQINTSLKNQIEENRKKITPIIETIILCGRQGLALRGHRDAGPINVNVEPAENDGNFRSLLRFRAKGGDQALEEHLNSCSQNAMYISPHTQNEIIGVCNDLILNRLINKVKKAKFFTILADETTDVQGIEQCSFCVRYIDVDSRMIREDFLQFVPVTDVTGKGLAKTILEQIQIMGLDPLNIRGQGYDGAAAMSGIYNGAQTHVREKYPLALYMHCCSHSLNLAVTDACTIQAIRNCMGTITNTYAFLKYPKRLNVFQASIDNKTPSSDKTRLKSLCPTRWVERHDAVLVFLELFDAVVDALETISTWSDKEASSNAQQLLCALMQPTFIIALQILTKVFSLSMPLSRFLQTENMDIVTAIESASRLEERLADLRKDAEKAFKIIFEEAENKAVTFNIILAIPRRSLRQTQRCNVLVNSPEEYFRIAIFIPFLDSFILQLKERFLKHKILLTSFLCLLPKNRQEPNEDDEEAMKKLVRHYSEDCACSEISALGELSMWYSLLKTKPMASRNPLEALAVCSQIEFPTVNTLLRIIATLPVTTATNERSFSTLRRLKTYLRSTTGESRLNGLALLNIHRDIRIEPKEVLDEFARKPRKLDFRL